MLLAALLAVLVIVEPPKYEYKPFHITILETILYEKHTYRKVQEFRELKFKTRKECEAFIPVFYDLAIPPKGVEIVALKCVVDYDNIA